MGASPWSYLVPHQNDIRSELRALQQRVFQKGQYHRMWDPEEYPDEPVSAEEVVRRCGADGTGSVLDIKDLSESPRPFHISPMPTERLVALFGTDKPTREMVERDHSYYFHLDRGEGVYIVLYKDGLPDEILFAGYSID